MQLYIITFPGMGMPETRSGGPVYTSRELAVAAGWPSTRIEMHNLVGALQGNAVFVAHTYEPSPDMFDLLGVYSDYNSAKAAAGQRSQVVSCELNAPLRRKEQ